MSSIKPKKGICIDCGPESEETYLIAERCKTHYWRHRSKVNTDAKKQSEGCEDKQAQKKALDLWYVNQIKQMPACCENCNDRLIVFAPWAAKAFVAHIVEKRNFKSVKIHPLNRLYLCLICHGNYDSWGAAKVIQMPVFDIAVERFMLFKHNLNNDELRYLPEYFSELMTTS